MQKAKSHWGAADHKVYTGVEASRSFVAPFSDCCASCFIAHEKNYLPATKLSPWLANFGYLREKLGNVNFVRVRSQRVERLFSFALQGQRQWAFVRRRK